MVRGADPVAGGLTVISSEKKSRSLGLMSAGINVQEIMN